LSLYRVTYTFMGTNWTKVLSIEDILVGLEDEVPELLMQAAVRVIIARRKTGRRYLEIIS
jgi:hypothetical protein